MPVCSDEGRAKHQGFISKTRRGRGPANSTEAQLLTWKPPVTLRRRLDWQGVIGWSRELWECLLGLLVDMVVQDNKTWL